MATTIKLKNSVTTTNAPSSLVQGEVAINITDKKVWVGNAATTPIQLLGAGASGTFGALTCTSLTNSGLTSGRVTYATTAGLLTDSANLTFNGTTLTAAAITSTGVATFSAGTVSAPAITTTGDTNTGIFFPAADTIAFTEGGVESMRIDSSGNVGMGRAPLYQLDVYRSGTQSPAIASANDNIVTILQSVGSSQGNVGTITSHPLCLFSGNLERVRIDTSGNVGIGTSSPSYVLHVSKAQGSAAIQSTTTTNSTYLAFINGGGTSYVGVDNSTGGVFSSGAYGMTLFNAANSATTLFTNATERMRITSGGNVGIGTSSPIGKFDVGGASTAASNTTAYIHGTDNASYGQSLAFRRNGSNSFVIGDSGAILGSGGGATILYTYGANHQAYYTNGSERMRIDSSGNVMIGGTVASAKLTVFSDISLRSGAAELSRINGQTATSVSTSATNILPATFGYGALAIVNGYSTSNVFSDLVFFNNQTAAALSSLTNGGSPAARTYTVVSGQLKLAMASGTYTVTAVQQYINAY